MPINRTLGGLRDPAMSKLCWTKSHQCKDLQDRTLFSAALWASEMNLQLAKYQLKNTMT